MTKFFIGYVKDEPDRADVVRADHGDELTGPEGGYDSFDGPFDDLHDAYGAARDSGQHVTTPVAGCVGCAEERIGA